MDRDYIAPQLSVRERIAAGAFLALDIFLLLTLVAIPALLTNLFSPTFPRRWKLGNAAALLPILALLGGLVTLFVWLSSCTARA